MEDITKQGVQGLKGMTGINTSTGGIDPNTIDMSNVKVYDYDPFKQSFRQDASYIGEDINAHSSTGDFGSSRYDPEVATIEEIRELNNTRAENQPWYDVMAASTVKAGVLAGTTFMSGTAGFALGGVEALAALDGSKVWNNEITRLANDITKSSEELMPVYYSTLQQEKPWYAADNLLSANFLGDKFLKNMGFTIGAMYSGKLWSGAMYKFMDAIGKVGKATNDVIGLVGATMSATSEGSIEALNHYEEYYTPKEKTILDTFQTYRDNLDASFKNGSISSEEYFTALNRIKSQEDDSIAKQIGRAHV